MLSAAIRAQEDATAAILRCGGIMVLHGIATQNMIGSYRHKWATDRPRLFRLSRSDKVSCGGILGGNEGERTRVVDFFIDRWYPTPTYSENHKQSWLVVPPDINAWMERQLKPCSTPPPILPPHVFWASTIRKNGRRPPRPSTWYQRFIP